MAAQRDRQFLPGCQNILKSFAYFILVLVFLQQSWRSIDLYNQDLRTTVTSVEGHATKIDFPDITICPSSYLWTNNSKKVFAENEDGSSTFLSHYSNETIYQKQMWILNPTNPLELDVKSEGLRYENGIVTQCQRARKVKPAESEKVFNNKHLAIVIRLRKPIPNYLNIYVHTSDERINSDGDLFGTAGLWMGTPLDPDVGIMTNMISITRELVRFIPDERCRKKGVGKPLSRCMNDFMHDRLNCTVPWLKISEHQNHLRPCQSISELSESLNFWYKKFDAWDEEEIQSVTGCKPLCSRFLYKFGSQSSSTTRGRVGDYKDFGYIVVQFSILQASYPVIAEVQQYPFGYLVGNIGGYLGLLLGFSALELVNNICKACFKGKHHSKRKQGKETLKV